MIKFVIDVFKMVVIGSGSYEEDFCVICYEDMNMFFEIVILECGYRYYLVVRIFLMFL